MVKLDNIKMQVNTVVVNDANWMPIAYRYLVFMYINSMKTSISLH